MCSPEFRPILVPGTSFHTLHVAHFSMMHRNEVERGCFGHWQRASCYLWQVDLFRSILRKTYHEDVAITALPHLSLSACVLLPLATHSHVSKAYTLINSVCKIRGSATAHLHESARFTCNYSMATLILLSFGVAAQRYDIGTNANSGSHRFSIPLTIRHCTFDKSLTWPKTMRALVPFEKKNEFDAKRHKVR